MRRKNEHLAGRYWDDSMEKEFEERIEAQQKRSGGREKNRGKKPARNKAPISLRVLAWFGAALFCVVIGYSGTSHILNFLSEKTLLKPDAAGSGADAPEISARSEPVSDGVRDIPRKTLSLFYPKDDALAEEKVEIFAGTFEDDIRSAVMMLLERSGLFGGDVRVSHVFRDVDLVYLDFSGPFASALAAAGEKVSTLLVTGIVRTMQNSFSIVRVRFLLDSKVANDGAPVNLTATWQLPR
jgi:hypothetical protein